MMASFPFVSNFFATPLPEERAANSVNVTQSESAFEFRERDACKNGCDCAAAAGYDTLRRIGPCSRLPFERWPAHVRVCVVGTCHMPWPLAVAWP